MNNIQVVNGRMLIFLTAPCKQVTPYEKVASLASDAQGKEIMLRLQVHRRSIAMHSVLVLRKSCNSSAWSCVCSYFYATLYLRH